MDKFSVKKRSEIMRSVKSKDTKLEIMLREELWKRGHRYRKNCKNVYGKPDIVFISRKIAVFCDSEFWHGYNWIENKNNIKSKRDFWFAKIERNIARDKEVTETLRNQGWIVLRFWEREIYKNMDHCLKQIENAINIRDSLASDTKHANINRGIRDKFHRAIEGNIEDFNFRTIFKDLTILSQQSLMVATPPFQSCETKAAPFQIIDFFSGCGGMSLGFAAVSRILPLFRIIGACDINKDALETFKYNFGSDTVQQDIRELANGKKSVNKFLSSLTQYDKNKKLILIGCAPCQGFTSHRKKFWADDDFRNTLVGAFATIAVSLHPDAIIMENVPELLSNKYWHHFEEARDIFVAAGYVLKQSIYNAASFGVPQERFRSLLVAMKKDFLLPMEIVESMNYRTVRDAIGFLPEVQPGIQHPSDILHRCAKHNGNTIETIKAVEKNGGKRPAGIGPKCLDKINGFSDVYGRLYWDKPSITITHYSRNPASGRFVHPEQNRGLTAREAALLQSFPVGFDFSGTFDSVFKQIGEAVPPLFSTAVAANVLVELLSPVPTEKEKNLSRKTIESPVSSSFSSVIAGIKASRGSK